VTGDGTHGACVNPQQPKPLIVGELFPGRYLKSSDLLALGTPGPWRVTMANVEREKTQRGDELALLYFGELEKPLVLKKTNAVAIAKLYGDDVSGWEGREIDLVIRQQDFGGETYDVIRVMPPRAKAAKVKVPDLPDTEPQLSLLKSS
jgi:hypothetical protein